LRDFHHPLTLWAAARVVLSDTGSKAAAGPNRETEHDHDPPA
jgi:hypothetical protein